MGDEGSSVTLIAYKASTNPCEEPFLNQVAAIAQRSNFTHVELALGEDAGRNGEMINVLRIFNDSTGVVRS